MIPFLLGYLRLAIRALTIPLVFAVASPALPAPNAFVRINQLGCEVGTHNRAYLMSKTSETGAVFRVTDSSGEVRFSSAEPIWAAGGNSPFTLSIFSCTNQVLTSLK